MIMHSAVWDESNRRTDGHEREFIYKQLTTDINWNRPTRTFSLDSEAYTF